MSNKTKTNKPEVKEVNKVRRICNVDIKDGKVFLNNMEATTPQALQIKREITAMYQEMHKATGDFIPIAEAAPLYDSDRKAIGYRFKYNNTEYQVRRTPEEYTEHSVYDPNDNRISGVLTNFNEELKRISSFKFSIDNKMLYLTRTSKHDQLKGYFSMYVLKEFVEKGDE